MTKQEFIDKNSFITEQAVYSLRVVDVNDLDEIYDNFSNRKCTNCKFNLANRGKETGCIMIAIDEEDMDDDFGCNKWEKNNDI